MLNGDAHMIAFDDGSNNRYASNGAKGFPVALSAAFSSGPQTKGMIPYSQGRKCTLYKHPASLTNYTTCDPKALIYDGMNPGRGNAKKEPRVSDFSFALLTSSF